jgi:hypothetical protein
MYFGAWYQWLGIFIFNFFVCSDNLSWCWNTNGFDRAVSRGVPMRRRHLAVLTGGLLFGFGLAFGGMSQQEIVLSFLQLKDLGLLLLLGSSAVVTAFTINLVPKVITRPLIEGEFKKRTRLFSKRTLIGAVIFGVGWGVSGQCPGSALASLGVGNIPVLIGIASMFLGAYVMGRFFN